MSARNIAYVNAPSITLAGTAATALPIGGDFLLISNPNATGAYVETGAATVTSTSLKGYVGAGQTQVFRIDPKNTHIISTVAGLVVQVVEGV